MSKMDKVIEKKTDVDVSGGVEKDIIKKAENELNLVFSKEYVEYLGKYGQLSFDVHEFTGLNCERFLDVILATKEEWKSDERINRQWYVVEKAGVDGIVIWQNSKGEIYQSSPTSEAKKIANSFLDYIEVC